MTTLDNRQLFDIQLKPVTGSRFQPTGFPDIGAATFTAFDGDGQVDALVVESAQSMANRLEGTAWDPATDDQVDVLEGLPYVRVVHDDDGEYLTSSRTEAHRLASAFIKDATLDGADMKVVIRDRLGLRDDRPVAPRTIAKAVLALDPLCLIHGVFFAENAKIWPGQPRIVRALTGQVEALGVKAAHLGGVKRDHVRHGITDTGGSAEGYGTIPFHRTEYTAERIVANVNLDLAQVRSYGLGADATDLLIAIARWEVAALFGQPVRLRTACDLETTEPSIVDRGGVALASLEALGGEVRSGIESCRDLLGDGGPLVVQWKAKRKAGKAAAGDTEGDA